MPFCFEGGVHVRHARQEDHRELQVSLADGAKKLQARHVRHHDVADDHVEITSFEMREGRAPVLGLNNLKALGAKHSRRCPANGILVIDKEYARTSPTRRRGLLCSTHQSLLSWFSLSALV